MSYNLFKAETAVIAEGKFDEQNKMLEGLSSKLSKYLAHDLWWPGDKRGQRRRQTSRDQ